MKNPHIVLSTIFALVYMANGVTNYVDSSAAPGGDGSIGLPYNNLNDLIITSDTTYLLKRGSTFTFSDTLTADSIAFESYGTGVRPVIVGSVNFHGNDCVIQNLKMDGDGGGTLVGFRNGTNLTINSCELVNGHTAFSGYYGNGLLTITNTVIHNMLQEGIYGDNLETVEIDDCHVYDVNQYWVKGYYHKATGDGIQIGNTDHITINNTLIDRSGTSGKFGIIIQGCTYFEMNHSQIIGTPTDALMEELGMGMYCAYMSGTTEAYFNDCWFFSGHSGIWNQYSGFIDVRNCKFILNEEFGMENIGNGYAESNLFYKAGYIGLGCGWGTSTELNGYSNILYDNVVNGRGFQTFDNNIWCPGWAKDYLYDTSPNTGYKVPFDPVVTNGGGWIDIPLYNGNDRTDLHLYQSASNFVEGYYIFSQSNPIQLFFDMSFERFSALPEAGVEGTIEFKKYVVGDSGDSFSFSESFNSATNFSFSGWSNSIYLCTITDMNGATLFHQYLLKNGAQFDPLDLSGADVGSNPLDVFREDTVVYSTDNIVPGQPRNLVETPYGFYFGYFLDLHTGVPTFFNTLDDELFFNPSDPDQRYTISIISTTGDVVHRERNTRGLCVVNTELWTDGYYYLSIIASDGTVWADEILHRDSSSADMFAFSSAAADGDSDGHSDWQERIAHTDPANPNSQFNIAVFNVTSSNFNASFQTATGVLYQIQWSDDLKNWQPHGNAFMGDGALLEETIDLDSIGNPSNAFIRLVIP